MSEIPYYDQSDPMMGTIEIHEDYALDGLVAHREYIWHGGPKMQISLQLLDQIAYNSLSDKSVEFTPGPRIPGSYEGSTFRLGPYRLRVLEQDLWRDLCTCIRMDYRFLRLRVWWHRASKALDLAYGRLIITAAVWRLADYNPAVMPSYKDLHAWQWFDRIRKKIRGENDE